MLENESKRYYRSAGPVRGALTTTLWSAPSVGKKSARCASSVFTNQEAFAPPASLSPARLSRSSSAATPAARSLETSAERLRERAPLPGLGAHAGRRQVEK